MSSDAAIYSKLDRRLFIIDVSIHLSKSIERFSSMRQLLLLSWEPGCLSTGGTFSKNAAMCGGKRDTWERVFQSA
jgi:hypothetical protein